MVEYELIKRVNEKKLTRLSNNRLILSPIQFRKLSSLFASVQQHCQIYIVYKSPNEICHRFDEHPNWQCLLAMVSVGRGRHQPALSLLGSGKGDVGERYIKSH